MPWKMIYRLNRKQASPVEDEITDESVELPEEEPEQGTAEAEASSENRQ